MGAGDRNGYRKACAAMLDRLDAYTTDYNPGLYCEATDLGALISDAVANPDRLVRMAEKALAFKPKDPEEQSALGAAVYRAGRLNTAVRELSASVTRLPQ